MKKSYILCGTFKGPDGVGTITIVMNKEQPIMKQTKSVLKMIPIVILFHIGLILWMVLFDRKNIISTSLIVLMINVVWMSMVYLVQHAWNAAEVKQDKVRMTGSSVDQCGHGIG